MSVQTRVSVDSSERLIVVERLQDVEDIIERNKQLQGEKQTGDMRLIASIPAIIIERWMKEDGVNYLALPNDEFARLIKRKINDPDYRWLRIK